MTNPFLPYGHRRHVDPVPGADALVVDDLTVGYPNSPRPAVRHVNLRVPPGTRVALVGPNGAGKSSLLKAIAGLLPASEGDIRIYGNKVGVCHHRVAYLPQREEIDWRFPISVERLVLTGRYVHLGWLRRPAARDREIARSVMERLGVAHLARRQIGRLSGGQQQRVQLARALAQGADLLLLDEPLSAVDTETRDIIYKLMAELRGEGKTLLVATHQVGRLDEVFDSVVYFRAGEVVEPPDGAFCGQPCCNPKKKEASWTG
jgi:ABC-type Mn2+/Zn2+ transport system ATPase subunit